MVIRAVIKCVSGIWSAWEDGMGRKGFTDKVPFEQRPEKLKSKESIPDRGNRRGKEHAWNV